MLEHEGISHTVDESIQAKEGNDGTSAPGPKLVVLPDSPTSTVDAPQGGNALKLDWESIFEPGPENLIVGNPPFVGISLRSPGQTADLERVWGVEYHGSLDFVTAWYKKAIDYARNTPTRFALVSTSSICQGEQVSALWQPIFSAGFIIDFAHRTFDWRSEAQGAAAVHVVIIGLVGDRLAQVGFIHGQARFSADDIGFPGQIRR